MRCSTHRQCTLWSISDYTRDDEKKIQRASFSCCRRQSARAQRAEKNQQSQLESLAVWLRMISFPSSILLYRARNRLTLSILLLFNDVVPMQFSMAVVNQVDRRPIKLGPFISMRNSYPERKVKQEKSLFDIPWHDRQLLVSAVVRSNNNKRPERERERESGQRHGRSAYDHL